MPLVSIIILGFNSKKYLKCCLDAVFAQSYPNLEIIYVDNDSNDKSLEFVEQYIKTTKQQNNKTTKIIKNRENLGFSGGQNIGIKNSKGEFVLCLNPDIILDKDYVKNIIALFLKNPKIGAVTGKLLKFKLRDTQAQLGVNHAERDTNIRIHTDDTNIIEKTNIIDSCGLEIFKSHRVIERGGGGIDRGKFNKQEQIFGVSGAAPIFRKSALEAVGITNFSLRQERRLKPAIPKDTAIFYFDEDFFAYKEDIDLSFRLLHAGYECWFEPKALAWHYRWETGSREKEKLKNIFKRREQRAKIINYLSYRNHLYFLLKNEFFSNLILYSPWIFAYELKKLIFGLFLDKSVLYGFWNFLKTLPLTLKKRNAILSKSKIKPLDIRKWLN